jgi:hypothetical protein
MFGLCFLLGLLQQFGYYLCLSRFPIKLNRPIVVSRRRLIYKLFSPLCYFGCDNMDNLIAHVSECVNRRKPPGKAAWRRLTG